MDNLSVIFGLEFDQFYSNHAQIASYENINLKGSLVNFITRLQSYYQYFYIFGNPLTRAACVIDMAPMAITDRLFYFNFELLVTFLTDT